MTIFRKTQTVKGYSCAINESDNSSISWNALVCSALPCPEIGVKWL
jgi:hypothetical protein